MGFQITCKWSASLFCIHYLSDGTFTYIQLTEHITDTPLSIVPSSLTSSKMHPSLMPSDQPLNTSLMPNDQPSDPSLMATDQPSTTAGNSAIRETE